MLLYSYGGQKNLLMPCNFFRFTTYLLSEIFTALVRLTMLLLDEMQLGT